MRARLDPLRLTGGVYILHTVIPIRPAAAEMRACPAESCQRDLCIIEPGGGDRRSTERERASESKTGTEARVADDDDDIV